MSGTHKYPTISFRISPREREEIEAKEHRKGLCLECSSEPVLLCIPALRKDAALSSPRNAAPLLWVLAGMRV